MSTAKITAADIRGMKNRRRIAALTAYDFPMTKLLDAAGIPLILVGDSLGMVVLGYPDTTRVTLAEMEHHVRAAARAKPQALLVADMPFQSYQSPAQALDTARRLLAAGAEAVKAEGGRVILPQVRAILADGIPFLAIWACSRKASSKKKATTSKAKPAPSGTASWPTRRPWPAPALSASFWNSSPRLSPAKSRSRFPSPPSASPPVPIATAKSSS